MINPVKLVLEKNVDVPVRDGSVLRADVFRPPGEGRYPVIMSFGPYGKDIHFRDFHQAFYETVDERGPFMNWETPNPDWWVPHGYVVIRVDERGTGRSPGSLDLFDRQEREDFYDAIEWAGEAGWSTGKVGLLGVSYYAILQWHVAAMQPPHLAAIVPWEGANDLYREFGRHGGILNNVWLDAWWNRQVTSNRNLAGAPSRDLPADHRSHPLIDEYHRANAVDLSAIKVPVLSAGNWGGYALHLRGNIEGYLAAGSEHKWLEIHEGNHLAPFYTDESRMLQKRFLDQWLKGEDSGMLQTPPVRLAIRSVHSTNQRYEEAWPIPRTRWCEYHLDVSAGLLTPSRPTAEGRVDYPAPAGGLLLLTEPFRERTEITGPIALTLTVASSAPDMDVFASIICLDQTGSEVSRDDAQDRPGPIAKGWLRVSHRELDEERSRPYRPVHRHTHSAQLTPGDLVDIAVEIRPTSMVFEAGFRLGLTIEAHDRNDGTAGYYNHDDPGDRPAVRLAGVNTIVSGPGHRSVLLLPIIPPAEGHSRETSS